MTTDPGYIDPGFALALALLLLIGFIAYMGWFFGRLHEAQVEYEMEQQDEAAYRWAAQHGRLPRPVVIEKWVDPETGEVLETREV